MKYEGQLTCNSIVDNMQYTILRTTLKFLLILSKLLCQSMSKLQRLHLTLEITALTPQLDHLLLQVLATLQWCEH